MIESKRCFIVENYCTIPILVMLDTLKACPLSSFEYTPADIDAARSIFHADTNGEYVLQTMCLEELVAIFTGPAGDYCDIT